MSAALAMIMSFGVVVMGIFAFIFLFYTNSFLLKRRKKEIGLYNILGMEKKHIGKILIIENVVISRCRPSFSACCAAFCSANWSTCFSAGSLG